MASVLPTLTKTWNLVQNQAYTTASNVTTDNKSMTLAIVNQLISWGWTCKGSGSTGSGGARDNTNRWSTISNIVASAWIELYNSTMGAYLLIQNDGSNTCALTWKVSYTGFSGGSPSATVAGTAADSFDPSYSAGAALPFNSSAFSAKWHGWQSTDGYVNKIVVWVNSVAVFLFHIEKPTNGVAGFPSVGVVVNNQGNSASNNRALVGSLNWYTYEASAKQTYSVAQIYVGSTALQAVTIVNPHDSNWCIGPLGVGSVTAAISGLQFWCADTYLIASSINQGSALPATGARLWVKVGDMLLPWSDVAMQII